MLLDVRGVIFGFPFVRVPPFDEFSAFLDDPNNKDAIRLFSDETLRS
jgi:hypothetical protein